jgi:ADP-heptose:LPS heptosyltransferase
MNRQAIDLFANRRAHVSTAHVARAESSLDASWMPKAVSPVVVRFGRLGDMVLLQPLLQHLHRRFGRPCTLLARGAWPMPLYAGHPDVARVIELRHAHWPQALSPQRWRAVLCLRRLRDAPVYVCEPEPRALRKARGMLALAGISQQNCVFLTDTARRPNEHWTDQLLRFGNRLPDAFRDACYDTADPISSAPILRPSDADRSDCDAWVRSRGWGKAPLILLQPANKRSVRWRGMRGAADDKWWPIEHWVSLARSMRATMPESCVLLCGTPREAVLLRAIREAVADAQVHVVADALPLRRLMALLQVAHSMVSVDTGPAHMAAALGCPLVVLFGRASPAQWMPRSGSGNAVCALGGPPRGDRIDALGVDEVIEAWRTLQPRR